MKNRIYSLGCSIIGLICFGIFSFNSFYKGDISGGIIMLIASVSCELKVILDIMAIKKGE